MNSGSGLFKAVYKKDRILYFVDTDPNSDFYFSINKLETRNFDELVTVEYGPGSDDNPAVRLIEAKVDDIYRYFEAWVKRLERYAKVDLKIEDPVLDGFTKEYYEYFDFVDDEAEKVPLKSSQILLLDDYLDTLSHDLIEHTTEENESDVQDIQEDIIALKKQLTTTSKAEVVKKLSKIWGKMTKQGVSFIKAFLTEAQKQVIQHGIKFIVSHGHNLID